MTNNSSKKKLSLNPPTSSNTEKNIEEFINQAENHTKVARQKQEPESIAGLPWETAGINAKVMKSLRLGIHEEYLLKLKYLSEHTDIPQQKIARAVLYPAIDAYLEQLQNQGFIKL
ncbi:MAG: hypothetical protein QNJ55_25700 [Xenococcus sp. MO_188.B8]|nr:hypothetical protein [Xenococcus sp. MO_188.B8]